MGTSSGCPPVQLALNVEYPPCNAAAHRYSPATFSRSNRAACSLDPFALWAAFPPSLVARDCHDYYGSSATPRRQQRTVRLPRTQGFGGHRRGASHVHSSTGWQGRRPAIPRRHRHTHRNTRCGLAGPTNNRTGETIPSNNEDRAPRQPIAASFGAAARYRGFKHWFVSYAFLPCYRTRPAGGRPLLDRQGLLPPSTSPQVSDCPSASPGRYGGRRRAPFTPTRLMAPRGAVSLSAISNGAEITREQHSGP